MFASTELNNRNKKVQTLYRILFLMMTLLLITPVLIILSMLIVKGGSVISWEFLTTAPTDGMTAGGLFPALLGTVWLVAVALMISVPLGVAAAIYLNEFAPRRVRAVAKPVLEILAGVPTVVYGFFAILTVAPAIRSFGDSLGLDIAPNTALAAGSDGSTTAPTLFLIFEVLSSIDSGPMSPQSSISAQRPVVTSARVSPMSWLSSSGGPYLPVAL